MRKTTKTILSSRFDMLGGFLDLAAPGFCVLLLLGVAILSRGEPDDPDRLVREAMVQNAIESIPEYLGADAGWILVGEVPVPSSQSAMLDLNAHISRLYQRLGSFPPIQATVFIANSRDARSMMGHHPPNCYPATGWILDQESSTSHEFSVAGSKKLPASLYKFGRGGDSGPRLWVVNGFLMPRGAAVATLGETKNQTARASTSRLGLTQYQIVIRGEREVSSVIRYASEILESLPQDFFLALGDGAGSSSKSPVGDGK